MAALAAVQFHPIHRKRWPELGSTKFPSAHNKEFSSLNLVSSRGVISAKLVEQASLTQSRQYRMSSTFVNSFPNTVVADKGKLEEALQIFKFMRRQGIVLDSNAYACLVQYCVSMKALVLGMAVHAHFIKMGCKPSIYLRNYLVNLYAKCHCIDIARQVFDEMPRRNLVSWNIMIAGYAQNGYNENALRMFCELCSTGLEISKTTFVSVLRACASLGSLEWGKEVHAYSVKLGIVSNVSVGNTLITMYAKCDKVEDCLKVFYSMAERNVVSWNAIIAANAQNSFYNEALELCCQMIQLQTPDVKLDEFTFSCMLMACASLDALANGKEVHAHIIRSGFELDAFVGNALVDMYAKCGSIEHARSVFDAIPEHNIVSWNAMIAGYAQCGHVEEVLELYCQMNPACIKPNPFTFSSVFKVLGSHTSLLEGKQFHAHIVKAGFGLNVSVGNALVTMYANCKILNDAHKVFEKISERDVISWNALIAGYLQNGQGNEALEIFRDMQQEGMKPTHFSFISVLGACSCIADLKVGRNIHANIIKMGCESHALIGGALIDMYAKCGSLEDAERLFDRVHEGDVVSCNAMLVGYCQNGCSDKAFDLFSQMQQKGIEPDNYTFATLIGAVADMESLEPGRQLHGYILKSGFKIDIAVGNSLLTMYAKCGNIDDAHMTFEKMPERNVISWTSMIAGYAQHGYGKKALLLFETMQQTNIKPNRITFVGVLSACSHIGLVKEGYYYFNSMTQDHGIIPEMEHYACMVDLLGRAGLLDEAKNFIDQMPIEPSALVWQILLGACKTHQNVELGQYAAECSLALEPQDATTYVLLSNIYAAVGKWDHVAKVRKLMRDNQVKKEAGCSWINVNGRLHTFVASDRFHPRTDEIYAKLEELTDQLKVTGYVPDTNFVLQNVEDEQKKQLICYHSERLAISLGLISTPSGTSLRIFKNLRVCGDCHTSTKLISKITRREIIVRDANRFHHFKGGLCSCSDYW